MPKNKIVATVEKIARSRIWLAAGGRKFYLPVELWPNAAIGAEIIFDSPIESADSPQKMLEAIIN